MPRTYGKSSGRAKQTRLSFVPAEFTSDGNEEQSKADSRNANVRYSHPSRSSLREGRSEKSGKTDPAPVEVVSVESEPEGTPQVENGEGASRRSSRKKGKSKSKSEKPASVPAPVLNVESEAEGTPQLEDTEEVSRRSSRKKGKSQSSKKSSKSDTAPSAPPPAPPSPPQPIQDDDSDSDIEIPQSACKRANGAKKSSPNQTPPPAPATQDEESDSDLEILQSARKKPREGNNKRKRVDSSESEGHHNSDESDGEEVVARPRRKLRRGGAPQPISVDDGSSGEEEIRATSKSPSAPHTPRRDSAQDRMDIEEDLEDLQDSVVKASRTRGNVPNSARAQRQRHLEALRRRRTGQKVEDEEEDQLSPQPEAPESAEHGEEEEEEEEEAPARPPQLKSWANESESSDVESTLGANEDLDIYEDDFVLDDENDKLGVPSGLEEMPIEFSRHAYKQLKDYFQDAVEWMVHNQLNPAFPRSDPVYKVAFDKLEAEVRGRTGSQLVSSVWNTDFRKALLARPHIEITSYPTEFAHPCDACNRSGHPASYDMKLHGKAYSLDTLEPLVDADSDDEQSDEEDVDQEQDRDGFILPDEDKRFYLGRHCKKNAALAHTLTHWRFHLNEWVVEHLRVLGYMSDKKILKRSEYSQKKKNKHTAKAFNKFLESGEVKKLWRDFHINLKSARESTV